ncbi:Transducin/WD40 repeat-like superfamily protein [Thalictrum thalictroides]|uniref:Transducin/WD40 repeat-like superfamily protein n=1 Tax=Thalictrum thalictroides TaxID=46969 RepID=A0A7J6X9K8_THATH|nr:Transducin/WD40 repeat-like superfamily protein [Thalictrum thalictroides]
MDKYVNRSSPPPQDPKPRRREPWKRVIAELDGKFSLKERRQASAIMLQSYTEMIRLINTVEDDSISFRREGISGLEFDSKGIYLVSVTKAGCLVVQDFDSLYGLSGGQSICPKEDESKHVIHLSTGQPLDVVRWNLANQDEVACTSMISNEVRIFDIGYISSDPIEVLKKRPAVTGQGCVVARGLSDIAFSAVDKSRLFASDMHGGINIWDRRMSNFPCVELTTNIHSPLNSIQLSMENQIVFGAGKHGIIYAWDLRGGRTSVAFQNNKEVYRPPLICLKLASLLEKIKLLKEQSDIVPREIFSIALDPSAPYQLAFHLDNGWSGVVDTKSLQVTHIHCPPPAWLNGWDTYAHMRKPAWLPTCSIYAVGSTFDNGVHLLDFYPAPISACHVDFNDEVQNIPMETAQNIFVPLSEAVTVCATHPLTGAIVAGTKKSSLLVISQNLCGTRGNSNEGT